MLILRNAMLQQSSKCTQF